MTTTLGFTPSENPFVVEHGGFYRRWLSMIDDLDGLKETVAKLEGTTQDLWVPVWKEAGDRFEAEGDRLEAGGDFPAARQAYLQAKTYFAIGRFPRELNDVKAAISEDCARAYRKACAHLDPPVEIVEIPYGDEVIRCHYRTPNVDYPVAALLIMCGADVFKEDRGWASDYALDHGMASLVMDGPGVGENPVPWSPNSVDAWIAAIEYLESRPDVDANRIGAFGISRGGYSVMQLAGTIPDRVKAVVASAGHPFGYVMSDEEMEAFVDHANARASWKFGEPDGPPSFSPTTAEEEREKFKTWALSEQGILDNITQPVLMINGKHDHLAPIGNIYFMLEHGPATGKEARVYADAGHCAFKYFDEWAPASFAWLAEKLGSA
ncbi:MAG: alpha/beta hydrolase [Acidimicrobiia bacterium]|nr:alpha/beta hydrolase [Acidimicrobiia bacterium]MDH5505189.1 alpha/beta hydrolase [Acidimicrobiia bacterium]